MLRNKHIKLVDLTQESWGFQALQPLAQVRHGKTTLGTIYKTFRNDPIQVPGKPIWTYSRTGEGGWALVCDVSEAELRKQVIAFELQKMASVLDQSPAVKSGVRTHRLKGSASEAKNAS